MRMLPVFLFFCRQEQKYKGLFSLSFSTIKKGYTHTTLCIKWITMLKPTIFLTNSPFLNCINIFNTVDNFTYHNTHILSLH